MSNKYRLLVNEIKGLENDLEEATTEERRQEIENCLCELNKELEKDNEEQEREWQDRGGR